MYVDEARCARLGPWYDAAQEIREALLRIIAQPEPPSPWDADAGGRAFNASTVGHTSSSVPWKISARLPPQSLKHWNVNLLTFGSGPARNLLAISLS